MRRWTIALGLALTLVVSGWLVAGAVAQSTQTAPAVREVNSANILAALGSAGTLEGVATDIENLEIAVAAMKSGDGINVSTIGGVTPVAALCDDPTKVQSKNVNATINGNGEIVALVADDLIYVCGYNLGVSGDVTLQLIYGTGTACATGETDIETLIFDTDKGYGIANPNAGAIQFKTPASNAFCVETSVSVTVFGRVSYVQQ